MTVRLNKELRTLHSVRNLPVVRSDEVKVITGKWKGKTGKVVQVYRRRWCIYVDKLQRDKQNGIFSILFI